MSLPVTRVAVVGHTNTGKTSLLRTLTRDVAFGEVASSPGTTRHVEAAALLVRGEPVLELYDTPGLEDASALLERLERTSDRHADGVERIRGFLESAAARGEFEQEAKVLRQVLASEAALYVVDARETMMGRHRDELTLLGYCARPLVPVLNFVASAESRESGWRELLARLGLHAVVAFDTVLFDLQGERRLYEKLQSMLETRHAALATLIEERTRQALALREAALTALADLLIDAAALTVRAPTGEEQVRAERAQWLRERVREREQRCVRELVETFAFRQEDFHDEGLAIVAGRWSRDLFAPETLREFGLTAGGGAVTGAAVGLGIDVLTGGLSLGAAALIGATAGALFSTLKAHGRLALERLRGHTLLQADEDTLRLLAGRGLQLVRVLLRRGHASLAPVSVAAHPTATPWSGGPLPAVLKAARHRPEWSALAEEGPARRASGGREAALAELTGLLGQWLDGAPAEGASPRALGP